MASTQCRVRWCALAAYTHTCRHSICMYACMHIYHTTPEPLLASRDSPLLLLLLPLYDRPSTSACTHAHTIASVRHVRANASETGQAQPAGRQAGTTPRHHVCVCMSRAQSAQHMAYAAGAADGKANRSERKSINGKSHAQGVVRAAPRSWPPIASRRRISKRRCAYLLICTARFGRWIEIVLVIFHFLVF
ncbi:uncharacterized protein J3D65DRAFT_622485 [Phyllosticta citribraziliensis]|uniref:Uncharacterized protein n=1 Tax=Phyllosticta citribraziliensis TaxID=989973 RepID=A0ABR1LTT7_9PEZI